MLRVTPELNERDYDHVLIDEAAAARLPEIVYAVSRATEGAALLGDFLQDGPSSPPASRSPLTPPSSAGSTRTVSRSSASTTPSPPRPTQDA
jgi:hypothetical protein